MATVWANLAASDSSKQIDISHLSNALSGYLPLTGGTMSNTNLVTNMNADLLDGYHESSFLRYRGSTRINGKVTLWNQIGIKEYYNALPDGISSVSYTWGAVISLPGPYSRFDIWCNHVSSENSDSNGGLYYRSGWENDKMSWRKLIDSGNIGSQSVNYANSAGSATSAGSASRLDYSGTGVNNVTAYQTSDSFMGRSGWSSYLIFNHGDGATYYSQTICMPFQGSPLYRRL
jgi:hypothetical protein